MKAKILLLLLAGLLLTGCQNGGTTSDTSGQTQEESMTGKEEESETEQEPYVLEFTGTTIEGEAMTSEILSLSKLTMINVWATYCPPCIEEMPDLGEIAREYEPADVQLIGIAADVMEGTESEEKTKAKEIIAEAKADYPHLTLNQELYTNLVGASDAVPTTYFFNQEGELLGYLVGAQSKEDWKAIIDDLLEEMEE